MSAHTPGPWKVETRTTRGEFVRTTHITTPDGSHLANVGPCNIDANARLIASAPDLLASLCAVLSFKFPGWETGKWDDVLTVKQARAAVARAKEGSK